MHYVINCKVFLIVCQPFSVLKYNNMAMVSQKIVKEVPLCHQDDLISDVQKMLFSAINDFETINYIYVIDENKKLVGVFSIKEIFKKSDKVLVKEVMEREVIKIRPHSEQEKVVILALKNNLKAIPVVDKTDKFLGVIPSDVILEILHSKNVEDFLRTAGINSPIQKVLKGSSLYLTRVRIPWLILGLLGGVFAAKLTAFFEVPLKAHFILASFIPLVVYMADAVGTQTQTLYIRNLALGEFSQKKYFLKEFKVGILLALILGALFFLIASFLAGEFHVGLVLGICLFFTIIAAVTSAILIPWILQKLKKDPALGSGPFATIVADISSLLIYFLIATALL